MDVNLTEYSDSDSGDSWTILEGATESEPKFPADSNERSSGYYEYDEDTDGISVISGCHDDDSPTLEQNLHESILTREKIKPDEQVPTHFPITQHLVDYEEDVNFENPDGSDKDNLIESSGKLKTYVHRRNRRLSAVLNIIMLGSFITAAGVAIGHMWGAKNDCTMHHTPLANKILSNLYKLQEENAYLRSNLNELTLLCNLQTKQKMPVKTQRCKKVFEAPLENSMANKPSKCIDNKIEVENYKDLQSHLVEPSFEKEFSKEVNHLKNVYKHNKKRGHKEIHKRIKRENEYTKDTVNHAAVEEVNKGYADNKSSMLETTKLPENDEKTDTDVPNPINYSVSEDIKKISYADLLNSDYKKVNLQHEREFGENGRIKFDKIKINVKENYRPNDVEILSDEEIKKDDRYNCYKWKYNKKKIEKWRKKQKQMYKQEQLDIKDLVTDNDDTEKNTFSKSSELDQKNENYENLKGKIKTNENHSADYNKSDWFEKRSLLRKQYRKRLEQEMFGDKPDDSAWYFRRMKKREQCRAKAKNETHKKPSKQNMNYKVKN